MSQTQFTEDLLDDIKLRSFAPISQDTFSDEKLLKLATDELRLYVAPLIMSSRENFFLSYQDDLIVKDKKFYPIAERALGNALKTIKVLDASEREMMTLERTALGFSEEHGHSGSLSHFILQGDKIRMMPVPHKTQYTLRQYYFTNPSKLVRTTECAKITGVTETSTTVILGVDNDISDYINDGGLVDVQNGQSPYLLWAKDLNPHLADANSITLVKSDVVGGDGSVLPGVGDYICPAYETNIPQIPDVYHSVLAQRVAVVLLNSLGDRKKWETAKADLSEMEMNAGKLIANRVESQPQKIRQRNTILNSISRWRL